MHPAGERSGVADSREPRIRQGGSTMRDSSTVPCARPPSASAHGRKQRDASTIATDHFLLPTVLGLGAVAWQHLLLLPGGSPLAAHLPYLVLDAMLAVPAAAAAVWLVAGIGHRYGATRIEPDGTSEPVRRAIAIG